MYVVYIGAFRFPIFDAAAARVLNNAKAFRKQGHSVKFISWGGKYKYNDHFNEKHVFAGFEYIITNEMDFTGNIINKMIKASQRGRKSLKLLNNMSIKPDLIIAYNADYQFTKRLIKFSSMNNIKFANDITEWYEYREMYFFDRLPYYFNMKILQHKVKNKIVISSYLDNYFSGSNNLLLPPLCDPSEEKWTKTHNDNRIKAFEGVTFIYAGNPAKKDYVHNVINAINRLLYERKKVRFIILGVTKENYIKNFSSLISSKELHQNILFMGHISQDEIPAYYRIADFMILLRKPTRKNNAGFPTKVAESITAGIPVITNSTSDLNSYISNGKTGFIITDYTTDCIYNMIQNHILTLNKEDIENMKVSTRQASSAFNCYSHDNAISKFFHILK